MGRSKKSVKKIIWSVLGILLGILIVWSLFFKKATKEVVLHSDHVVRETLTNKVSATGTINPVEAVEVGTQVSGTVDKLYVDFNDKVSAGQVVARMDTRNLLAAVKESEANLLRADVQKKQAKRTLDRTTELFKSETVSEVEMEKADDDYQLALANYNTAKLQLERNRVNLGYATITSPIEGIVISKKVEEGQTVAAAFATPAIFVIARDLKKMKIEASVDEADIGQVRKGQQVEFYVDAYPDEIFNGTVELIQLQPVTLQNVVTYTVEVLVDNPDLKLMPGMTATLDITISQQENVLTVANGTFDFSMNDELKKQLEEQGYNVVETEKGKDRSIWVVDEMTFREVPVKHGYSNGIKTEISGDVKEGAVVVSNVEVTVPKRKAKSFMQPPGGNQNQEEE